jgi:transposase
MAAQFFLSDAPWAAIEPLLPTNQPGACRVDDRRVISGVVHVLRTGCRWQDTPAICGPPTTICNRFHRWSQRGVWQELFAALVRVTPGGIQAIDSTTAKAQRASAGGKGGLEPSHRPLAGRAGHQDPRRRR